MCTRNIPINTYIYTHALVECKHKHALGTPHFGTNCDFQSCGENVMPTTAVIIIVVLAVLAVRRCSSRRSSTIMQFCGLSRIRSGTGMFVLRRKIVRVYRRSEALFRGPLAVATIGTTTTYPMRLAVDENKTQYIILLLSSLEKLVFQKSFQRKKMFSKRFFRRRRRSCGDDHGIEIRCSL